jgi:guanylate kinase
MHFVDVIENNERKVVSSDLVYGEDGRYHIDFEDFEKKIAEGKLLEHAEFVGNYYGTPLDEVNKQLNLGKEVILEIEVEGALQVREKVKDAVFIFLVPPSREALYNRLKRRGTESEEVILERIEKANREFKLAYKYDYIVVNDEVNNAADRIMAIIRAEHAKTWRSIHKYEELLGIIPQEINKGDNE